MRTTKTQLRQIIKEELEKTLKEMHDQTSGEELGRDSFEKEEGYLTLKAASEESQKDRHPIDRYYPQGDYVEARIAGYTESEALEYAIGRVPARARGWLLPGLL